MEVQVVVCRRKIFFLFITVYSAFCANSYAVKPCPLAQLNEAAIAKWQRLSGYYPVYKSLTLLDSSPEDPMEWKVGVGNIKLTLPIEAKYTPPIRGYVEGRGYVVEGSHRLPTKLDGLDRTVIDQLKERAQKAGVKLRITRNDSDNREVSLRLAVKGPVNKIKAVFAVRAENSDIERAISNSRALESQSKDDPKLILEEFPINPFLDSFADHILDGRREFQVTKTAQTKKTTTPKKSTAGVAKNPEIKLVSELERTLRVSPRVFNVFRSYGTPIPQVTESSEWKEIDFNAAIEVPSVSGGTTNGRFVIGAIPDSMNPERRERSKLGLAIATDMGVQPQLARLSDIKNVSLADTDKFITHPSSRNIRAFKNERTGAYRVYFIEVVDESGREDVYAYHFDLYE